MAFRVLGLAFASIALAIAISWFATGATSIASFEPLWDPAKADHYISFDYEGTDADVARTLKRLADEGYPAVDATAGSRNHDEHSLVILKGYTQPQAMSVSTKISREFGGGTSWGTLQEQFLLGDILRGKYSFGHLFVFAMAQAEPRAARAVLFVISLSVTAAALLALLTLVRGTASSPIRWLGLGLSCWAISVCYLWLFEVAPVFAPYQLPSLSVRVVLDILAFALLTTASYAYIRFWKGFPQPISDEELAKFLAALKEEQIERLGATRRRWFGILGRAAQPGPAHGATEPATTPAHPVLRRTAAWALLVLVVLCAGSSWTGGFTLPEYLVAFASIVAFWSFVLIVYWPGLTCMRVFKYHRSTGSAEDCKKIEWIWASIWMGFVAIIVPFVLLAGMYVGRYFFPSLEEGEHLADTVLIFGLTCGPLLVILALAMSILYRGTIDPRLALRGVTLWTLLGVILTLMFVLVERSIALRIARWWNLPPQTGYVTAGALVAATFQPIRKRAEKHVNRFVERVLPTALLASGDRRTAAVAVVDISGYTALSARDEPSALLASALVQKESRRLADKHAGRVVKSTGDGVIMCFANAQKCLDTVTELHRAVGTGAAALNLSGLVLHSGLHWGELVEMHDGDIYGMTVNVAARIADWAKAGEIGASEVFHAELKEAASGFEAMGPQSFKNVPEPVVCFRLADV